MDPSICLICASPASELHRFPRDKKRLTQWLLTLKRADILEKENYPSLVYNKARLCDLHFDDWCFTGQDRKKLIKTAVPRQLDLPFLSTDVKTSLDKSEEYSNNNDERLELLKPVDDLNNKEAVKVSEEVASNTACESSDPKKKPIKIENALELNPLEEGKVIKKEGNAIKLEEGKVIKKEGNVIKFEEGKVIKKEGNAIKLEEGKVIKKEGNVIKLEEGKVIKKEGKEKDSGEYFDFSNLEPDRIIGATDAAGELFYLIKWKRRDEASIVPSEIANEKYPDIVIKFFEERLRWKTNDGDLQD